MQNLPPVAYAASIHPPEVVATTSSSIKTLCIVAGVILLAIGAWFVRRKLVDRFFSKGDDVSEQLPIPPVKQVRFASGRPVRATAPQQMQPVRPVVAASKASAQKSALLAAQRSRAAARAAAAAAAQGEEADESDESEEDPNFVPL